jgi:hypothetical protein
MWSEILTAIALVFVLEGLVPFISPRGYKEAVRLLAQLADRQLRTIGLISMLGGVLLLYLVR